MAMSEQIQIRDALLYDLQGMFAVDQAVRDAKVSTTYDGLTTKHIFGLDTTEVSADKRAVLLEEIAKLLDLSIVAVSEGKVCGFAIGRQAYIVERDAVIGEIAILGVHPAYQHHGVATRIVNVIHDKLRSRGVSTVLIKLDPGDEDMKAFFAKIGFSGDKLLSYAKTL
jgi:GNAT superfamily N-acetyltransferase